MKKAEKKLKLFRKKIELEAKKKLLKLGQNQRRRIIFTNIKSLKKYLVKFYLNNKK